MEAGILHLSCPPRGGTCVCFVKASSSGSPPLGLVPVPPLRQRRSRALRQENEVEGRMKGTSRGFERSFVCQKLSRRGGARRAQRDFLTNRALQGIDPNLGDRPCRGTWGRALQDGTARQIFCAPSAPAAEPRLAAAIELDLFQRNCGATSENGSGMPHTAVSTPLRARPMAQPSTNSRRRWRFWRMPCRRQRAEPWRKSCPSRPTGSRRRSASRCTSMRLLCEWGLRSARRRSVT